MMKILKPLLILTAVTVIFGSCKKEEIKPVDFSNYNADNPETKTKLDEWLKTNFLDEYNSDVIYRYNRYNYPFLADNIPIDLDNVQPSMQSILDGYVLPYRTAGGEDFIKKNIPKQWVLTGALYYTSSTSTLTGNAQGGVRVTLYGMNNYNPFNTLFIVHKAYTAMINQQVAIPIDFEAIAAGGYVGVTNTLAATSKDNGFITPLANSKAADDFTESAGAILVRGEAYYDNYANGSSVTGKVKLKQKEANIENYFTNTLKVDFRLLQKLVQVYLRKVSANVDIKLGTYIQKLYKTVTINSSDVSNPKYGIATDFATMYNNMKTAVGNYSTTNKLNMDYMQIRFDDATLATIRIAYTPVNGGTQSYADYSFSYTNSTVTATYGDMTFTKVAQAGTTGNYANANNFMAGFTANVLPYFTGTNKIFTANWLNADVSLADFNKIGAFYQKGNTANYWYGTLAQ